MPDSVLLRFRDLTVADTVGQHNRIVAAQGRALWGWWKKPAEAMPDPGLSDLQRSLTPGQYRALFIDSGTRRLYRAPLLKIHYQPGGEATLPDPPDLCPEYYRAQQLPAWFEIGKIDDVTNVGDGLDGLVFSKNNRIVVHHSVTSLHESAIGQTVSSIPFLDSNVSLWLVTPLEDIGIVERGEVVRPLDRGLWPTKGRFAVHLSDLHFGSAHAFRNELGESVLGRETLFDALVEDFETLDMSGDVAMLLVTGDLTWKGDPHEFANASRFLRRLASQLGLHHSQVVISPGNHDIEWRDGMREVDPNAELNFANFCRDFYRSEPIKSFLRIARFKVDSRPVTVIALNSCRLESKENAGLGFIGREQLLEVVHFMRGDGHWQTPIQGEFVIAQMHHHLTPVNYVEGIDWNTKRVSITLDADGVIRSLIGAGVRVALHGHQHQPYVAEIRRVLEGYVNPFRTGAERLDGTLALVGAGSIGVDRSHLNTVGRNSYNIIDLADPQTLSIRTRVQSPVGPGFSDYQRVELKM